MLISNIRIAKNKVIAKIKALMDLAIELLQTNYLSPEQVAASYQAMGLDTKLIEDGTHS